MQSNNITLKLDFNDEDYSIKIHATHQTKYWEWERCGNNTIVERTKLVDCGVSPVYYDVGSFYDFIMNSSSSNVILEISDVENQNDEIHISLIYKDEDIDISKSTIRLLPVPLSEIDLVHKKIDDKTGVINNLVKEIGEYEKKSDNEKFKRDCSNLKKNFSVLCDEVFTRFNMLENSVNFLKKYKIDGESIENIISDLKTTISETKTKMIEYSDKNNDIFNTLEEYKASIENITQYMTDIESWSNNVQKFIEDHNETSINYDSNIAKCNTKLDECDDKINIIKESVFDLEKDNIRKNKSISNITEELNCLIDEKQELEESVNLNSNSINKLSTEMNFSNNKMFNEMADIKNEIKYLRDKTKYIDLAKIINQLSILHIKMKGIKDSFDCIDDLKEAINYNNNEINNVDNKLNTLCNKVKNSNEEIKQDLDIIHNDNNIFKCNFDELYENVKNVKKDINDLKVGMQVFDLNVSEIKDNNSCVLKVLESRIDNIEKNFELQISDLRKDYYNTLESFRRIRAKDNEYLTEMMNNQFEKFKTQFRNEILKNSDFITNEVSIKLDDKSVMAIENISNIISRNDIRKDIVNKSIENIKKLAEKVNSKI